MVELFLQASFFSGLVGLVELSISTLEIDNERVHGTSQRDREVEEELGCLSSHGR